jgi:hypothetical protein
MNLKNGYNHVKNGWKYIYIEGNPYDRGYAYGSAIVDAAENQLLMGINS